MADNVNNKLPIDCDTHFQTDDIECSKHTCVWTIKKFKSYSYSSPFAGGDINSGDPFVGGYIESGIFEVEGSKETKTRWALRVHPNGANHGGIIAHGGFFAQGANRPSTTMGVSLVNYSNVIVKAKGRPKNSSRGTKLLCTPTSKSCSLFETP